MQLYYNRSDLETSASKDETQVKSQAISVYKTHKKLNHTSQN